MPKKDIHPWLPDIGKRKNVIARLFLFPYGGAAAEAYRPWIRLFPENIEVLPVQLPGRSYRILEQPRIHFEHLIDELYEVLEPYLDLPFALFGHSMGGLIAYGLAQLLENSNLLHVHISGHPAPSAPKRYAPLALLPDQQFLQAIKDLGGAPPEIFEYPDLIKIILPTLRADFELCVRYKHEIETKLSYPMMVYGGTQDALVYPEDLEPWAETTSGPFEVHLFPGNHFYIHRFKEQIAEIILNSTFVD